METKANTTLIGAFTLVVLALGFVFVYWLARGSEQSSAVPLKVVFEDPVTGLGRRQPGAFQRPQCRPREGARGSIPRTRAR